MVFQIIKKEVQEEEEEKEIIPGLLDEIALECLVRIPHQFHINMKSVCHTWQNLISHPSFYHQRSKSGNSEHLVCLVQPLHQHHDVDDGGDGGAAAAAVAGGGDSTDPLASSAISTTTAAVTKKEDKHEQPEQEEQRQQQQQIHSPPQFALSIYNITHNIWQRTKPQGGIPMFCQCLAIPFSRKILLLGGWDSTTLEPVPDVYILDLMGCKWRRGASMSVSRSFFACAVVGDSKVYVAGGHDGQKNALKSAEVYDVEKDEWEKLPDMVEERDECQGLSWDGDSRFWVVSGYGSESQGQFRNDVECYDQRNGCWSKFDGIWPFGSTSPRGGTASVSLGKNQNQWWWFFGVSEQQQQQERSRNSGEVKETDNIMRLEIVSSIPVPDCVNGSSNNNPCVISLGFDADKNHQRVFVMSGNGKGNGNGNGSGRTTSSSSSSSDYSCSECDCGGAFIMDRDCNNGSTKWNHIHKPAEFSGFPFSACHLTI